MYNEIRAILSHLNEVTPNAAILSKVEAKTEVTGSLLDVKVEDHRNKRMSMLVWWNYFFGFADNPRRNNTKMSSV